MLKNIASGQVCTGSHCRIYRCGPDLLEMNTSNFFIKIAQ